MADQSTIVRKRNDAYTGLLAISFLAMSGATVLLYLEYQNYENKTPPKGPVIDVPGTQLKTLPGTGGAPPPPPMMPPDDPEMKKDPAMMKRQPPAAPAPIVVETVKAPAPLPPLDPVVTIPDVPILVPVSAVEPVRTSAPPVIIPMMEPNVSDVPPLPTSRFAPPM